MSTRTPRIVRGAEGRQAPADDLSVSTEVSAAVYSRRCWARSPVLRGMACMLRINFSTEDIARTRIAAGPDPLWELVLSIQMLRGQPGDLLFTQWRRTAATALRERSEWRLLLELVPQIGYFPDFLNPAESRRGLEHGLEAVRATPRHVLAR